MADKVEGKVSLTKEYIKEAFSYLEEVDDLEKRNIFFTQYMVEDVTWEITGKDHRLVGTRNSIAEHNAASFARLREKLTSAIRFVIRNIILDNESRMACIELFGFAKQLDGEPYDNDYSWTTQWNDEGKIFFIRSYHDTDLAEKTLDKKF